MKFFLQHKALHLKPEVEYLLKLFAKNQKIEIEWTHQEDAENFSIGFDPTSTLQIPQNLTIESLQKEFRSQSFATTSIQPSLSKILYLTNSLQEYGDTDKDALGRFQFKNSYQFKEQCVDQNLVQQEIDKIADRIGLKQIKEKSRVCLTHDMDSVYGSIYEDGLNVIKKGRFDIFFQMLLKVAIGKPEWLNVDHIMQLESEYDCKSIFFWIMNKARYSKHFMDADYSFKAKKIQDQFKKVESAGFDNGLHKSISKRTFEDELTAYGDVPLSNRYHYLKFSLPQGYEAIDQVRLQLDFSLGFSEKMGFRNSYGLPFTPFNFKERKPYSFLEVPLHIMDRTFFQYDKKSVQEVQHEIFTFFHNHQQNCVFSILWHNNFFSEYKYKGYRTLYKNILIYLKENSLQTITQQELIEKYAHEHNSY